MNSAYSKAYAALGMKIIKRLAINNMDFLLRSVQVQDTQAFTIPIKMVRAKIPAFLDDYAFSDPGYDSITGDYR